MVASVVFSSSFKVAFVATWKVSCGELRDRLTRRTSPQLSQLVAKCEQILCMTSCEFDEREREVKFVAKADPLSTIRNNKLIVQVEKLETSAKL